MTPDYIRANALTDVEIERCWVVLRDVNSTGYVEKRKIVSALVETQKLPAELVEYLTHNFPSVRCAAYSHPNCTDEQRVMYNLTYGE